MERFESVLVKLWVAVTWCGMWVLSGLGKLVWLAELVRWRLAGSVGMSVGPCGGTAMSSARGQSILSSKQVCDWMKSLKHVGCCWGVSRTAGSWTFVSD